jgi:hypothetical protein
VRHLAGVADEEDVVDMLGEHPDISSPR